jgi:hypothetical protein
MIEPEHFVGVENLNIRLRIKIEPPDDFIVGRFLTNLLNHSRYLSSAIALPLYFKAECAAARRAIGTRNGEQET